MSPWSQLSEDLDWADAAIAFACVTSVSAGAISFLALVFWDSKASLVELALFAICAAFVRASVGLLIEESTRTIAHHVAIMELLAARAEARP